MSLIESKVLLKLLKGLEWSTATHIDAVVIGGTAVCHYIPRHLTPDIDFLTADLENIKGKLGRDNIEYTTLASYGGKSLGISIPNFEIDLLDSNSNKELNNYIIQKGYQGGLIAGYHMKIISPEVLCIMKFQTSRDKDDKDAFALLQAQVLNKATYLKIINDLGGTLKDVDTLKSYAEMITS